MIGVFHLRDLQEEDFEILKSFECSVEKNFYAGELTAEEIEAANKIAKDVD